MTPLLPLKAVFTRIPMTHNKSGSGGHEQKINKDHP